MRMIGQSAEAGPGPGMHDQVSRSSWGQSYSHTTGEASLIQPEADKSCDHPFSAEVSATLPTCGHACIHMYILMWIHETMHEVQAVTCTVHETDLRLHVHTTVLQSCSHSCAHRSSFSNTHQPMSSTAVEFHLQGKSMACQIAESYMPGKSEWQFYQGLTPHSIASKARTPCPR